MEYLRGELHYYRSIPTELTHLFPTLVGASEDASQAMPSMTITKASGRDEVHVVEGIIMCGSVSVVRGNAGMKKMDNIVYVEQLCRLRALGFWVSLSCLPLRHQLVPCCIPSPIDLQLIRSPSSASAGSMFCAARAPQIDGVSFCHLVTNHCLTRGRFDNLLDGLHAIHTAKAPSRGAHAAVGGPTFKGDCAGFSEKEKGGCECAFGTAEQYDVRLELQQLVCC